MVHHVVLHLILNHKNVFSSLDALIFWSGVVVGWGATVAWSRGYGVQMYSTFCRDGAPELFKTDEKMSEGGSSKSSRKRGVSPNVVIRTPGGL